MRTLCGVPEVSTASLKEFQLKQTSGMSERSQLNWISDRRSDESGTERLGSESGKECGVHNHIKKRRCNARQGTRRTHKTHLITAEGGKPTQCTDVECWRFHKVHGSRNKNHEVVTGSTRRDAGMLRNGESINKGHRTGQTGWKILDRNATSRKFVPLATWWN